MYYLASSEAKIYILDNVKGVAQQGINLRDLRDLPTPAPSREVQSQSVRQIEAAFAQNDQLAAEAKNASKLIDHLDHAVLGKAFRGELVPQDPTDEPASVLLERIRAAREVGAQNRRRTSGR